MKNLEKSYVNSNIPKYFPEEKPPQEFPKEEDFIPEEKSYIEEVEGLNENYEEETTLKITPSAQTDKVIVDTNTHDNLSKLEGTKVRFVDFYRDARTFLEKANSTKFVLVSYILLSSPVLLILGYLSEDVYREILIIISLTYLGVDAYEKKTQVRHNKRK